jgi:diguanylate cyclase (GGDEF)-like protein/PAS domain S-box-containing protein
MENKATPTVYAWLSGRSAIEVLALALLALIAAGTLWHARVHHPGHWLAPTAILMTALGFVLALISAWRWSTQLVERRETALRLAELMAEQQAAESLAMIGSWMFDMARGRMHLSDGALKIMGLPSGETSISGRDFLERVHVEDRERWRRIHRNALRQGIEARIEYRVLLPEGATAWVRSVARLEGASARKSQVVAGIVQDITAMSAISRQLAQSEAKYRDLTRLSADWVWETDEEGRLAYLSESADAAFGGRWIRSGMGKPGWEFHRLDLPRVDWEAHRLLLARHEVFENLEFALIDPEGELHHVKTSGSPVFDDTGRFLGYRGVGRNVTREFQQRLLLQIEGEIAAVIREHSSLEEVIREAIHRVCALLAWSGGVHLTQVPGARLIRLRERHGSAPLLRILAQIGDQFAMSPGSVEDRVWAQARAVWIPSLAGEPEFAMRYRVDDSTNPAALVAPLLDENNQVVSALLLFSPTSFQAPTLIDRLGDILSRTLSQYLQRKQAEERLLHASLHDALTGLPNRVFLTHQLEESLRSARRAAVLYVDLDRYKFINDTLGHSVGDQVLIEVARRLRESLRRTDVAGRMGGDEFILLLMDLTDRQQIEAVARKVLQAIERPFILMERAYFLSASIGIAVTPDDGRDAQALIRAADNAMYRVKSEGRNDVRFFNGESSDDRTAQLELASEFPMALQRGEVVLHYQPVMAMSRRQILGIEGLMRWRHPKHGLLTPDRFLPMVERNNLAETIGMWTIRRAVDDRLSLGLDAHPDLVVSINLSPRQLLADDFLNDLNALMSERAFPARLLRLELTENALIDNSEQTIGLLTEIRRLGIQVVIDNFGTGYASLSYLKHLPIDGLKIDHTFTDGLPEDRGNTAIIQSVTTLARSLGIQAMVEGVENAHQLKALRALDCDLMQGTYISEPLPLSELEDFLSTLPQVRQMHLVSAPAQALRN